MNDLNLLLGLILENNSTAHTSKINLRGRALDKFEVNISLLLLNPCHFNWAAENNLSFNYEHKEKAVVICCLNLLWRVSGACNYCISHKYKARIYNKETEVLYMKTYSDLL